jgi:hypothetical protein
MVGATTDKIHIDAGRWVVLAHADLAHTRLDHACLRDTDLTNA